MTNNSTTITKTNKHLPPITFEHNKDHDLLCWISMSWDRQKHVVGLNRFIGSQPPSDNWISKENTGMDNQYKPAQIRFHSQKSHMLSQQLMTT